MNAKADMEKALELFAIWMQAKSAKQRTLARETMIAFMNWCAKRYGKDV